MATLDDLARADAVHWAELECGSYARKVATFDPAFVTCLLCRRILKSRAEASKALAERRPSDRRYHEELRFVRDRGADVARMDLQRGRRTAWRVWQAERQEEQARLEVEFRRLAAALPPVEIVVDVTPEERVAEPLPRAQKRIEPKAYPRRRQAGQPGYGIAAALQATGRKTPLREWERGLDDWPDVHLWQAFEAIDELRRDQAEDRAHWPEVGP